MGRPKSLLQWQGVPLIQYQIQALATAGVSRLIVVLGYQVESISPFVHGAKNLCVTINPRYREGKT
ncbi:MAG: NTP transferase domain-containing protein, partial [Chloroflexi bacterium]|nr:NTP transferase domain-containing protein [Chloroflexota bacterium]